MSSLDLTDEQMARLLGHAQQRSYAPGEVLIEEGDEPRAIFFLRSGRVLIERDHLGTRVPIDDVGPGEVLGEMSFVAGEPASATVVADEPTDADVIPASDLDALLQEDLILASSFYRSLARTLAVRLRRSTDARIGFDSSFG